MLFVLRDHEIGRSEERQAQGREDHAHENTRTLHETLDYPTPHRPRASIGGQYSLKARIFASPVMQFAARHGTAATIGPPRSALAVCIWLVCATGP